MNWHKSLHATSTAALAMAGARYLAGSAAFAAGNDAAWGPGMMYGYGGWQSMGLPMIFGGIFGIAVLAILIVAVTRLARSSSSGDQGRARTSTGLEILEERYARGEINREEYLGKKRDILGEDGTR